MDKQFTFPHAIKGWLTEEEGRFLADKADGKDVLEIGSYCGRSTVCLAQTAASVCAVDPFDGRSTPEPGSTLYAYDANLTRFGIDDKVTTYIGTSKEALPRLELEGRSFDFIFVDGAHDKASVMEDTAVARRLLRVGGLVAFHDYRVEPGEYDGRWDPGVTAAIGQLVDEGSSIVERCGSVAVLRLGNFAPAQPDVRRHFDAARAEFEALGPSQDAMRQFDLLVDKLCLVPIGLAARIKTVGKKRAYLGMPHLGPVEIESVVRALRDAHDPHEMELAFVHHASSLLANGFNKMWCDALNNWNADYWCLLHADIEPVGEKWLHLMIDELEAGGFNALHAVSPIKDSRGVTSTAAGIVDEPFGPVRKLTIYEMLKCPETFDSSEMFQAMGLQDLHDRHKGPWCMLPNTGCLVVKLGPWARRFPGFTINDRIMRILKDGRSIPADSAEALAVEGTPNDTGKIVPQVASEDWNFGRWMTSKGLKVGGTRKLKLHHFGRGWFGNHNQWGDWLQDEGFLSIKKLVGDAVICKNGSSEQDGTPPECGGIPSTEMGVAR